MNKGVKIGIRMLTGKVSTSWGGGAAQGENLQSDLGS